MRCLRSDLRRCWLARVMTFLLVAPYLLVGPAARAQRTIPSAYVLDFNNRTTVGGALLGRVAAAQVALYLSESPNWDIIQQSQVQRRIEELRLEPPFDYPERVQIADGVDAAAVIYGSITDARIVGEQNPQAYVRIQVLVEDIKSGVLINGAIAEGTSTARMGFTGDADILLDEALAKAAFRAREFMDRFRLPEGTVLNTTVVGGGDVDPELEVLINIGARQGVRRGMQMIVTRQREPVGRIKITSVDTDISTGRVTNNLQGIRPEDRARAIFNFADFPITRARLRAAADGELRVADNAPEAKAGPASAPDPAAPLRVARADRGDFIPFRASQDANLQLAQNTVQPPPPVVVDEPEVDRDGGGGGRGRRILGSGALKMLVGGLLVLGILAVAGRGSGGGGRADDVVAFGHQLDVGAPGAFIRVCWDRPKPLNINQIIQYVIYRADELGNFLIVGALDTEAIRCFRDHEGTRTVANVFTDAPGGPAGGRQTLENVPGLQPGLQYRYQIATVFENGLEDRDGDGQPDVGEFITPLSKTSPWATAIAPPRIIAPQRGEQVQLDNLAITWEQTPGADTYFVWVSRDPRFRSRDRIAFGPFRTIPVEEGGPQEVTQEINAERGVLRGAEFAYITVGGRNSADRLKPEPFGAIFSPPIQVEPEITPPDNPRAEPARNGGKRGRKADPAAPKGRGGKSVGPKVGPGGGAGKKN